MSEYTVCDRTACRTVLTVTIDTWGHVELSCHACERNRAGLCRDCPAKLPVRGRTRGNAMRCEACAAKKARADELRLVEHRRPVVRRAMQLHRARPDVRERRARAAREYRRTHPRTDADRLVARVKARARRRSANQKVA